MSARHTLTTEQRMERRRKAKSQPRVNYYQLQKVAGLKYDYSQIDEAHREQVQQAAVEIHGRLRRSVEDLIETGRLLNEMQELLHYRQFYDWAQIEFGLSRGSVFEFSRIATRFAEKRSIIEHIFTPTIVRRLAAVSIPDEAVEAVIAAAQASPKRLRVVDATAIVQPYLPPKPPKPKQLPAPEPEQPEADAIEVEYTIVEPEAEREFHFPDPPLGDDKAQVIISKKVIHKLLDGIFTRALKGFFTNDERDEMVIALTRALEADHE